MDFVRAEPKTTKNKNTSSNDVSRNNLLNSTVSPSKSSIEKPNSLPLYLQHQMTDTRNTLNNKTNYKDLNKPTLQAKLFVGKPGDTLEREADAISDKVIGKQQAYLPAVNQSTPPSIQAKSHSHHADLPVPDSINKIIQSPARGSAINQSIRSRVEPVLDANLSDTRIHTDADAQKASSFFNAKAFTHNNNIFLGKGENASDVQLLAHEATHVVQQRNMPSTIQRQNAPAQPAANPIANRPEFANSGYDEASFNGLINPWSSEMESELTRLTRFASGFDNHGRSMAPNPDPSSQTAALNLDVEAFVNQFFTASPANDRARMTQLIGEFVNGYASATPSNPDIADNIERQQGGYDNMAAFIAQHSGRRATSQWRLSRSPQMMQLLHDIGYWRDFDRRVVQNAETEYSAWTDNADPANRQRSESHVAEHDINIDSLTQYWRAAGRGTTSAATSAERSSQDQIPPWSAAFISNVMMQAGATDTFAYSGGHATYAIASRRSQSNNTSRITQPSRLLDARTEPVHVGGLIHRNRTSGTGNVTYANLRSGVTTHSDIVVGIEIYNAQGDLVAGHYQDIIDQTDAATLQTFQIFAVTIGGNTTDQELTQNPTTHARSINTRSRSGSVATRDNETVGRRFWQLNTDLTVNNTPIHGLDVYGIQRLDHPPTSAAVAP